MTQTILPFKIQKTKELITPNSGLLIYLELFKALKTERSIRQVFPKPGSGKGFKPNTYVLSILLLFLAGGKFIEDIRKIALDKTIRKLGNIHTIPSSDATGNWLRANSNIKIIAMKKLHQFLTKRFLKESLRKEHTLDIDAFGIYANKDSAKMTYKGEKGYMPIVGHLSELDWCLGYEFREGNVPPCDRNYQFIIACFDNLPKDHRITRFRSDGAAYQAKIFNLLDRKCIKFTISGSKNSDMKREIQAISETAWKPFKDRNGFGTNREIAESYACMEKTEYFRIVVQRWPNPNRDLFNNEAEYCYRVICTNYSLEEKASEEIVYWHNLRGNSERYHSEAKSGFNLDYLPCDDFKANAIWFAIGLLAYNFHIFAKEYILPESWRQKTISSIRWQLMQIAGKIVKHARNTVLKLAGISDDLFDVFEKARYRCWLLCAAP